MMKKRLISLLSAAALISTMAVTPVHAAGNDWQKAYYDKLKEINSSVITARNMSFSLYDLDGNDTPELLVSRGTEQVCKCEIYTFTGGKAVKVGDTGSFGSIVYSPSTKTIATITADQNGSQYKVSKMEKNKLTTVLTAKEKVQTSDSGKTSIKYTVNGKDAKKDEFTKAIDKQIDSETLVLGRGFSFSSDEMSYAVKGVSDYKTAYKAILTNRLKGGDKDQVFSLTDITGDGVPELILNYTDVYTWSDKRINYLGIIGIDDFGSDFPIDDKTTFTVGYNKKSKIICVTLKTGSSVHDQYFRVEKDHMHSIVSITDIAGKSKHTYLIDGDTSNKSAYEKQHDKYGKAGYDKLGKEYNFTKSDIASALK